ncbi:MAG TPA: transposase, partial [Thermomicrobiales bacterium]|nr:transposase [Thermomicrobiales bacterium]
MVSRRRRWHRGPRGDDAANQVTGRKRHLLVEAEGFVVTARIHPANETEAAGAKPLLAALAGRLPRLALIWVDGGDRRRFAEWASAEWGWRVEVAQHADAGRPHVW